MAEPDYAAVSRSAKRHRVSLAEWVRGALRDAVRQEPEVSAGQKLRHLEAALRNSYPAAGVDDMLAETTRGQSQGLP